MDLIRIDIYNIPILPTGWITIWLCISKRYFVSKIDRLFSVIFSHLDNRNKKAKFSSKKSIYIQVLFIVSVWQMHFIVMIDIKPVKLCKHRITSRNSFFYFFFGIKSSLILQQCFTNRKAIKWYQNHYLKYYTLCDMAFERRHSYVYSFYSSVVLQWKDDKSI